MLSSSLKVILCYSLSQSESILKSFYGTTICSPSRLISTLLSPPVLLIQPDRCPFLTTCLKCLILSLAFLFTKSSCLKLLVLQLLPLKLSIAEQPEHVLPGLLLKCSSGCALQRSLHLLVDNGVLSLSASCSRILLYANQRSIHYISIGRFVRCNGVSSVGWRLCINNRIATCCLYVMEHKVGFFRHWKLWR
jgi:hypothetical protein